MSIQVISKDDDYFETLKMYESLENEFFTENSSSEDSEEIYKNYENEDGWYSKKCSDEVCEDYVNGECLLGEDCKYKHLMFVFDGSKILL